MRKLELAAHTLEKSCAGPLVRKVGTWSGLITLAYHRIGDPAGSIYDRGLWSATSEMFDAQVRFLQRNFDVIHPDDLHDVFCSGHGRYVLITFDDGYRDNYEVAFPILQSHRVPATFFVSTGFVDRPRYPWWDEIAWMVRMSAQSHVPQRKWLRECVAFDEPQREQAIRKLLRVWKALPGKETENYLNYLADATGSGRPDAKTAADLWMTWDMLRDMDDAGMCIGGHTVNHPVLANLNANQQKHEVAGCTDRLRCELGKRTTCFSYPVGATSSFNSDTRTALQKAGIDYAFSYYGGFGHRHHRDPYDIPRASVELDMSLDLFRATLTLPSIFA